MCAHNFTCSFFLYSAGPPHSSVFCVLPLYILEKILCRPRCDELTIFFVILTGFQCLFTPSLSVYLWCMCIILLFLDQIVHVFCQLVFFSQRCTGKFQGHSVCPFDLERFEKKGGKKPT